VTITPEVIDALIASGVTAEQLAAAIKADLAVQQQKIDEKRAKAAAKKRRQREAMSLIVPVCPDMSQGHEGTEGDSLPPLVPPSSPCTPSNPPIIPPSLSRSRGERLKIEVLPDDWMEAAISIGHRNPVGEFSRFRDYWVSQPGQKGVKADWLATWRNWCRRACEGQTTQKRFRQ
jgi:hypothetical protein